MLALTRYRKHLGLSAVPSKKDATPLLVSLRDRKPITARRLREQGLVQVRVRVDEQGRPERALILRSAGSQSLDDAALTAVRVARFKPYTENGVAQPFWVDLPIEFQL